jgi:uncharacterized surface protein with fasciclin (FAS1) repeats
MAKPVIKKNCKGEITAASVAPEYEGKTKTVKRICKEIPLKNIIETLKAKGFTTLVNAIATAGLTEVLADEKQQFTIFAPTNAAFEAIADQLKGLNKDDLISILTFHVLAGKYGFNVPELFDTDYTYETINQNTVDLSIEYDDADQPFVEFDNNKRARVGILDRMSEELPDTRISAPIPFPNQGIP